MERKWVYRLILLVITGSGYILTTARSVTLWDCGEFIACIKILGIPHPPGAPFFMLLGRVWSQLLFFIPSFAYRINLLSAVSSVISCLFLFEIACFFAEKARLKPFFVFPCGLAAGTLLAFSDTFWFNGVESEVYSLSTAGMLITIWIVCRWSQSGSHPFSPWTILLVYVSFLGIGLHMNAMLFTPILLFFSGLGSGRVTGGRYVYLAGIASAAGLLLLFIYPEWIGMPIVLACMAAVIVGLVASAVLKGEIRDISFWALILLLCSVIVLTRPFILAATLLAAVLSLMYVFTNHRELLSWFFLIFNGVSGFLLFKYVGDGSLLSFSPGNAGFWICIVLAAAVIGVCLLGLRKKPVDGRARLRFYLLILLSASIGYSTHLYIPIRSQLNPAIDENNPDSWERMQAFLERKQYGSESMLTRMFQRRGSWASQFGYGPRMGFFRFQSSQFFPIPEPDENRGFFSVYRWHLFLTAAAFLLALGALAENFSRNRRWIALLLGLYLSASAGIVLYINFSDGTRIEAGHAARWTAAVRAVCDTLASQGVAGIWTPNPNILNDLENPPPSGRKGLLRFDERRKAQHAAMWKKLQEASAQRGFRLPAVPEDVYREVRDRDYFFTPAFVLFALIFSLGLFMLLEMGVEQFPGRRKLFHRLGILMSLTLWCVPFASHLPAHNRFYDFTAADYAWNVLQTCPPGAILFTNGDNDTFPLWYMQQVEGVRRDVTLINFSLGNMDWYARQLVYHDSLLKLPSLEGGGAFAAPQFIRFSRAQRIPLPGDTALAFQIGGPDVTFLVRTQDRLLIETVMANYPGRPVCFTQPTPASSTLGLENHFQTLGLVKILSPEPGLNTAAFDDNVLRRYRYRFTGQSDNIPGEAGRRIVSGYARLIGLGKAAHLSALQQLPDSLKGGSEEEGHHLALEKYTSLEQRLFSPNVR